MGVERAWWHLKLLSGFDFRIDIRYSKFPGCSLIIFFPLISRASRRVLRLMLMMVKREKLYDGCDWPTSICIHAKKIPCQQRH